MKGNLRERKKNSSQKNYIRDGERVKTDYVKKGAAKNYRRIRLRRSRRGGGGKSGDLQKGKTICRERFSSKGDPGGATQSEKESETSKKEKSDEVPGSDIFLRGGRLVPRRKSGGRQRATVERGAQSRGMNLG